MLQTNKETQVGTTCPTKMPNAVLEHDIERIAVNADAIKEKAMELTDSWEGVMFVLSQDIVENLAIALGFNPTVASSIHREMVALDYATKETNVSTTSVATWHITDATFLVLRGVDQLDSAFEGFSDENLQQYLDKNQEIFQRIRKSLPSYAGQMNFKPETASKVLKSFGANISPDLLFALASKYDTSSCLDIQGRRGVSAEFIRSVSLTLTATL